MQKGEKRQVITWSFIFPKIYTFLSPNLGITFVVSLVATYVEARSQLSRSHV
jgi:adenine C2-methylase RlmN of 23S rRNA A2503 and tRNA A37